MAEERSGASILIECLVRQGVEFVFGYPGGAVLPIYDELFADERLRHILVRHEAGAAHAASRTRRTRTGTSLNGEPSRRSATFRAS